MEHIAVDAANAAAAHTSAPVPGEIPAPSFKSASSIVDAQGIQSLPSKGSARHVKQACVPCKFYRTKKGCADGAECAFCHLPHMELTRAQVNEEYLKFLMWYAVDKELATECAKLRGPPYGLVFRF
eukprot:TRINITY_DN67523_c0_g1_i1.p1 TRINITY_DN67523_c0_g1~~TRINITY_DN67523_c0_g1_i1.p1  ORF type:complete len:126 (+),score=16.55 TRINITY_DN67523_c0_g1_i1:111-488(+)